MTCRKSKCRIGVGEIEFLGYKITGNGIQPTNERYKAIQCAPIPKNKPELQSILGSINFYQRFLEDKATVAEKLHRLLDQDKKWLWTSEHTVVFNKLKGLLHSDELLVHYDPEKVLVLCCDASPYGVGAALAHRDEKGERPIAYTSKTLNKSQRNYAQLDKEAFAIIFGVCHFHLYLAGRQFTIVTDHKPLLGLLNPEKQMPAIISHDCFDGACC